MPAIHPTFDWSRRSELDWSTPAGLDKLRDLVRPSLPFTPSEFQLRCSASILNGTDVFCVSATGDGKSGLIFIPAISRKGTITLVIEPTNFLESDLSNSLAQKGLRSVVINAETLAAASKIGHNLWEDAKTGTYQVILLSPESLSSAEFNSWTLDPNVRARWATTVVDEAHLVDEWGADFRPCFKDIWSVRARSPDHTAMVGMSASVMPGRQTDAILRSLDFRTGAFHFERRDCERHNVDFIFRDVKYPCTGLEFRDLDWLIPSTLTKASDVVKRLLYIEQIDLGHRVTVYLRTLVPPHLRHIAHLLIRHVHSMNCPDCKRESLAALYQTGDDRECAIFVTSPVLEVGVDVADIDSVVLYPKVRSASALVQRGGRPARARGSRGQCIVYVTKNDAKAALIYAASDPPDPRLLTETDRASDNISTGEDDGLLDLRGDEFDENAPCASPGSDTMEIDVEADADLDDGDAMELDETPAVFEDASAQQGVPMDIDVDVDSADQVPKKAGKNGGKGKSSAPPKTKQVTAVKTTCTALQLIIAAHARRFCITRQINIIYGNPGVAQDCGRCSSCRPPPTIDGPRPLTVPVAKVTDPSAGQDKTPGYMKLLVRDVDEVAKGIQDAALGIRRSRKALASSSFLSARCFLTGTDIKAITRDFHLVTSQEALANRMKGWRYWDAFGLKLWSVVETLGHNMREKLEARHEEAKAKRRAADQRRADANVKAALAGVGLDQVKRVNLRLPETPPSRLALNTAVPLTPGHHNESTNRKASAPAVAIPPKRFYASTSRRPSRAGKREILGSQPNTLSKRARVHAKQPKQVSSTTSTRGKENNSPPHDSAPGLRRSARTAAATHTIR